MEYCSKCLKIYSDNNICECVGKPYGLKPATMQVVDVEPVCKKCGSTNDLKYHERYRYLDGTLSSILAHCTCAICDEKARLAYEREEAMKYLIINNRSEENEFCESKDDVEKYLDDYVKDFDCESTMDGVIVLKLELVTEDINAKDFLDPKKSHLLFWDYETYRVVQVIEPEVEYNGDIAVIW